MNSPLTARGAAIGRLLTIVAQLIAGRCPRVPRGTPVPPFSKEERVVLARLLLVNDDEFHPAIRRAAIIGLVGLDGSHFSESDGIETT